MSLRPNSRTEARRNRYKVAVDAEEGRRRREDNMVEIRKNKREESLLKKRREGLQQAQQFASTAAVSLLDKKVYIFFLLLSFSCLIGFGFVILEFLQVRSMFSRCSVYFGFFFNYLLHSVFNFRCSIMLF